MRDNNPHSDVDLLAKMLLGNVSLLLIIAKDRGFPCRPDLSLRCYSPFPELSKSKKRGKSLAALNCVLNRSTIYFRYRIEKHSINRNACCTIF